MTEPEWDDERLASAFHGRFDGAAPPTLVGDVRRAIAGTSPARFALAGRMRTWAFAAVVAVGVVGAALGLAGVGRLGVGPSKPPGTAAVATPSVSGSTGPSAAEPPASVLGLGVLTVSAAQAIRDGGVDDREIAVRGWFTPAPPLSCGPAPFTAPVSPLQLLCPTGLTWLDERPESLFHVRGETSSTSGPLSPALNPDLMGLDTSWVPTLPVIGTDGDSTPAQVVLLGHFDDRRASLCPTKEASACRDRFVVDQVAWVSGAAPPHSVLGVAESAATSSVAGIETIVATEAPQSPILSMEVVSGPNDLASIEPSLARGQQGLIDRPVLWIVRVLESERVVTYVVVDGTDVIYELGAQGDAVLVGGSPQGLSPSPSQSAAPWPPVGATVVKLTSLVAPGDLPVQVAVVDESGRLTGAAETGGAAPSTLPVDDPGAYSEPGKPGRVHMVWTGGICDSHITVTVAADLRTITLDMGPQPACDAIGIGRQLVLDFSGSVDVFAITFVRATADRTPTTAERGYALACGRLDQGTCERNATAIVARYMNASPPQRVISIRFHDDPCGSYQVDFDDGTSNSTEIDCYISPSPS